MWYVRYGVVYEVCVCSVCVVYMWGDLSVVSTTMRRYPSLDQGLINGES